MHSLIHSLIHSTDAIGITMIRSRASIFYGCISGKFDDDNQKVIFHSILSISLRNSMRFVVWMHHFHRFIHKWVRELLQRYNGFLFELNENLLDIFIWIKTSYALHTHTLARTRTHARLHMFPYPISGTKELFVRSRKREREKKTTSKIKTRRQNECKHFRWA